MPNAVYTPRGAKTIHELIMCKSSKFRSGHILASQMTLGTQLLRLAAHAVVVTSTGMNECVGFVEFENMFLEAIAASLLE